MIFDVTRESLAEGLDVDFMTGEYPYKNRLATAMVPLFRVSARCRADGVLEDERGAPAMQQWPAQPEGEKLHARSRSNSYKPFI